MSLHYGPMLRALAHNRRDYRVLVFATAVGYTVVVQALAFASLFKHDLAFDNGIDSERVVAVTVEPTRDEVATTDELSRSMMTVPGVEDFSWVTRRIFRFTEFGEPVAPIDDSAHSELAWPAVGDEHLLTTLGAHLLAGRNYAPREQSGNADTEAVVTRSLATFLAKKDDPQGAIGLRFVNGIGDHVMRIVGVTDDIAVQTSFVPVPNHVLFSYSPITNSLRHFALVRVRSSDGDTLGKLSAIARDNGYWSEVMSLRQLREITSRTSRGATFIQIIVIVVVLFVGLIGNFGAASFSVAERSRTIGIRRALGATRRQIIRYFLEENLLVTTGGIIIGLPIAIAVATAAARIQRNFVLQWEHLVLAAVFFYVTSLWAAHAPALKASRIPPSVVSRAA